MGFKDSQLLRVLATLPEDFGAVPSAHTMTPNHA